MITKRCLYAFYCIHTLVFHCLNMSSLFFSYKFTCMQFYICLRCYINTPMFIYNHQVHHTTIRKLAILPILHNWLFCLFDPWLSWTSCPFLRSFRALWIAVSYFFLARFISKVYSSSPALISPFLPLTLLFLKQFFSLLSFFYTPLRPSHIGTRNRRVWLVCLTFLFSHQITSHLFLTYLSMSEESLDSCAYL